jgi:hypothetical protein
LIGVAVAVAMWALWATTFTAISGGDLANGLKSADRPWLEAQYIMGIGSVISPMLAGVFAAIWAWRRPPGWLRRSTWRALLPGCFAAGIFGMGGAFIGGFAFPKPTDAFIYA